MDFNRQETSSMAKPYLFAVKITLENVPAGKEDEFDEIGHQLSARCRSIRFLKENTSDVFTVVEISFDEFEDFLVTTSIKKEYLKSFKMTVQHFSHDMKPVYEEKFIDCKAVYIEEFLYDKSDTSQEHLIKTIGVKCKRF
ncbi:MAG: hypothetical protein K6E57_04205 [Fibrobacter sp.]|nr:hypothetical protein [Fibrobacter sp.]